jgi:hypothetical protein
MGVQVYWVLFFITDNQEILMGVHVYVLDYRSPGVLGFIFYNGQPSFILSDNLFAGIDRRIPCSCGGAPGR